MSTSPQIRDVEPPVVQTMSTAASPGAETVATAHVLAHPDDLQNLTDGVLRRRRRRAQDALRVASLGLWDVVAFVAVFGATAAVAARIHATGPIRGNGLGPFDPVALVMIAVSLFGLMVVGSYARSSGRARRLAPRFGVVAFLSVGLVFSLMPSAADNFDLPQFIAVSMLLPAAWILGRRLHAGATWTASERLLIVGSGYVADRVADQCRRHGDGAVEVVGLIDDDAQLRSGSGLRHLGTMSELGAILRREEIDRVIVAFSNRNDAEVVEAVRACDRQRVRVEVVPRLFDLLGPSTRVSAMGTMPLVDASQRRYGVWERIGKRTLDIVASSILLLVSAPILAVVAIAVKLGDRGPVLFRQPRIGRGRGTFQITKFRTMVTDADRATRERVAELERDGAALADVVEAIKQKHDPRITPVGRFLRRSSLDELPQLWNVLRGDMSLVGPRPLCDWEVDGLNGWQASRNDVRPGITGLWQIMGRSDVQWGERMQLDYTYVRHWSLWSDLRILFATVNVVLRRKGAV